MLMQVILSMIEWNLPKVKIFLIFFNILGVRITTDILYKNHQNSLKSARIFLYLALADAIVGK